MMSLESTTELTEYRDNIYASFPKRGDAIMNLVDSMSSHGHRCKSVVQLSEATAFERQYSSITDAIADGPCEADWTAVEQHSYNAVRSKTDKAPHRFIVDCTGNARPHASRLHDRHVTHAPNPAPGNKPIVVGHQYSVLTSIPNNTAAQDQHWLMPLSAMRVQSYQKGNEVGMTQIIDSMHRLKLNDELCISIGDTLYGSEYCRITASTQDNLIHLFRLNTARNIFSQPNKPLQSTSSNDKKSKGGRKQECGDKMKLGDPETHSPADQSEVIPWVSRKGKQYTITISAWNDRLVRGSRQFRSSKHPINVCRVEVIDAAGQPLYKRPLWLGVFGKRRSELSLSEVCKNYYARYDIEHFFRFSKRNLLLDSFQSADVTHEENWWSLGMVAYSQLYLAKDMVPLLPKPWERYLPEYKNQKDGGKITATPSQTQRGFLDVLKLVGTPAKPSTPRGKPVGRAAGDVQPKRDKHPVIFKTKKPKKEIKKKVVSESEKTPNSPDPQKINELLSLVQKSLGKMNITTSAFTEMLINLS
jgi:hypothetical protein